MVQQDRSRANSMLPAQPSRNELASFWLKTPGPSSKSVYKLQERELPPSAVCAEVCAEFQVQAGLHDIDIGSEVARKCPERPNRAGEPAAEAAVIVVAKAVVIVFNEPGQPVEECIFTANANCPAAPADKGVGNLQRNSYFRAP